MADKEQIIIDGCNVSGCVQFTQEGDCCNLGGGCKGWANCYFKQLARKTQECEELKEKLKIAKEALQYYADGEDMDEARIQGSCAWRYVVDDNHTDTAKQALKQMEEVK